MPHGRMGMRHCRWANRVTMASPCLMWPPVTGEGKNPPCPQLDALGEAAAGQGVGVGALQLRACARENRAGAPFAVGLSATCTQR